MRQLVFENTDSIKNSLMNIRSYEKRLNEVLREFNKLNLGVKMTDRLLSDLIYDTRGTVVSIYKDKIPENDQYTGLKNDKENILNTIKLPDLKYLTECCYLVKSGNESYLPLFDIDGEISLNEARLIEYNERFRTYALNKEQKDLFDNLKEVEKHLNALNNKVHLLRVEDPIIKYDLGELFSMKGGKINVKAESFRYLTTRLQ
jgi:hypothetical protein